MKPQRTGCPPQPSVVGTNDVVEHFGQPFTLTAGHPQRRVRCLACATLIGGQSVRTYTLSDFRHPGCMCGAIPCVTYLICARHGTDDGGTLLALALDRHAASHKLVV